MTPSPRRRCLPAVTAAVGLALASCSGGGERLELGAAAPLDAEEPLAADFAVLSVVESSVEESGLTGIFGTELDGVPWLVGYRIDLTEGAREDFSWDAVSDLSNSAWVADTGSTELQGSGPGGTAAAEIPCLEQGTEVVNPVLMYGCQVFVVPEGQSIESIRVIDVGTWTVED
ncbi:hypothetical protein IM660_11925 [Ruania alkalisoli]|uniref:Uncharacterized protein n=1 Tax=Ruania alkalisoli TaxID=2779775 RepID=A0A7M1SQY2_9MICO|nr:hypothetical protein [Ruania alkalisoli]QOR69404.1 hypothetical protein IM660_11925 [Ruania alkalisoli]